MHQGLLERRAGEAEADAAGVRGQVNALGGGWIGIARAEKQAQPAAKIGRAQQQRTRSGKLRARLDEHDGGPGRQRAEE